MELTGYLGELSVKTGSDGALKARVPLIFEFEDTSQASQIAAYLNQVVRVTIESLQLSFDEMLNAVRNQPPLPFDGGRVEQVFDALEGRGMVERAAPESAEQPFD